MRFAKNTQDHTSKVLRLPRKMTMEVQPSEDVEPIPLCGQGFRRWLSQSAWRQVSSAQLEEPNVGITNWSNNCYLSAEPLQI
eukprot:s130_g26.t1